MKRKSPPRGRAKNAWAIVYPNGVIDLESITGSKKRTSDMRTIADEEIGAKARPVRVVPR